MALDKSTITYLETPLWLCINSMSELTKSGYIITRIRYVNERPRTLRMMLLRLYDIKIDIEKELETE